MADLIYNKFKTGMLNGSYILGTGAAGRLPIYVALVNNSYSPNPDHVYASAFMGTYEIGGTGYSTGGLILSDPMVVQDDAGDRGKLTGSNMSWDGGTFSARYAVLYGSSGGGFVADPLIAAFDFTTDKTVTAGTFTIQWNAAGILNVT
jgi:hypothetical protein